MMGKSSSPTPQEEEDDDIMFNPELFICNRYVEGLKQ